MLQRCCFCIVISHGSDRMQIVAVPVKIVHDIDQDEQRTSCIQFALQTFLDFDSALWAQVCRQAASTTNIFNTFRCIEYDVLLVCRSHTEEDKERIPRFHIPATGCCKSFIILPCARLDGMMAHKWGLGSPLNLLHPTTRPNSNSLRCGDSIQPHDMTQASLTARLHHGFR